ncbi:MAG: hypothetical protein IPM57_08180 [Oligoflexia bacterium]|nr:hypothetical protein [Oligoflexia bacterium]
MLIGYPVRICSESSVRKLHLLDPNKKIAIKNCFLTWHEWIKPEIDTPSNEHELEQKLLKKALDYYKLKTSEEFWKSLKNGDLIEVYGQEMVQLYRSLSFFKYSGYSLLDLSVHEWYVLWERPSMAQEKMQEYANKALSNDIKLEKFLVQKHILREIYDTGKTEPFAPRAILVEFKNISSLKNSYSNIDEIAGFICTSRATKIAEGEDAKNIQFV